MSCQCGQEPDRKCNRCEVDLCDLCDYGDWRDQESLCQSCKEGRIEENNQQQIEYWNKVCEDLNFIKENYNKVKEKDLFINKFVAMADSVDWYVDSVCSNINDMTDRRYREIKLLLLNNLDLCKEKVKNYENC